MVMEWAKKHGHSCYFLKHGQLLYKHVIDSHKSAICFTEDQNHFLLYTTAAPFQNQPVKEAKLLPTQVLPNSRGDKSPPWAEWQP